MNKFSIVMPIIQTSYLLHDTQRPTEKHNNFERFFRIGWPSLMKNIVWKDVATFFVIVRENEKEAFQLFISKNVPTDMQPLFELVCQESLIKVPDMEKYRVQMLSKILIATKIETPYYLIIDDDNVALRPFGYNDIFSDRTQKYVRYTHDDVFHENWFRGSADLLQVTYDNGLDRELTHLRKQKRILSVTPEIFIKDQSLSLIDKLKRLHGPQKYQNVMASIKGRWTEYTLMWIHLMQQGPVTNWYRGSKIRLSDNRRNIWFASPNLTKSLTDMWADPKPYFGVIQSNVPEHEVDIVVSTLQSIFG